MRKLFVVLIVFAFVGLASCADVPQEVVPAVADVTTPPPNPQTTTTTESAPPVTTTPEPEPEPEPVPEFLTVRACAVGDNLIHSPIYQQAARRVDGDGYDFKPAYEHVMELIASFDLKMINQETLICNDIFEPSNWPFFNSPVALGDFMIEMGFNVFGIANNHTLDKGMEGLYACLDYWEDRQEKHDIAVAGAYYDIEDRQKIRTLEINGIVFSFLSYAESLNGLDSWLKPPAEVGRFSTADMPVILAEIEAAKEISDFCVVFIHWGIEDWNRIEPYQRTAATQIVEAGADFILGTHPHVLRDIEYIEREDGTRGLVAYSLANFISAQSKPPTMIGGVLTFDITVHNETRAVEITDVLLIPTITHYDANYSNVRIYPLSEYTRELAAAHGVREFGTFGYDYIYNYIRDSVSEEYLQLE